jgi:GNAT superfamily N-acetyltransferase
MFQIRECRGGDFARVVELLGQLWPDRRLDVSSLQKVYERGLLSEQQAYVCALENEQIIGFGSLTFKNNLWQEGYLAHVDELVVDRAYRERGIGTQLLAHLIEIARRKGCRRVELDSAFHRTKAHQFYESQGFENRAFLYSKQL